MHIDCLMNLSSMNMQKIARLKRLLSTKYYQGRGRGGGMKKLEHTFEIMNFSSSFFKNSYIWCGCDFQVKLQVKVFF